MPASSSAAMAALAPITSYISFLPGLANFTMPTPAISAFALMFYSRGHLTMAGNGCSFAEIHDGQCRFRTENSILKRCQRMGVKGRVLATTGNAFSTHKFQLLDPLTRGKQAMRSEEHTSELQSLMRTSY